MDSTSNALLSIDMYKQSLLTSINIGITATNKDDEYSVGLRNGLRICKAYIDGQEPEYEAVPNEPLTWDELKQMEGKPVWVEVDGNWWGRFWAFVEIGNDSFINFYQKGQEYPEDLWKSNIGKTWNAFRKERIQNEISS